MPRKPYSNGLLNYLIVTKVDNSSQENDGLPYILDIWLHLLDSNSASKDVVL